jgi:2-polyprenyl-3-methyl-5-hydroxy-6-metoxy-1,4-benzoquinol methylase
VIQAGDLISKEYRDTQRALHAGRRYGRDGARWAPTVLALAEAYDVGSILDYGCGGGRLGEALRGSAYAIREYDPAIKGKESPPSFADLVTCTDVLEHCEPDKLVNVLAHIRALARKVAFLVVSCRQARTCLADGRNAHLIIQPKNWWRDQVVAAGFTLQDPPTVLPETMPRKGTCWIGVVTP